MEPEDRKKIVLVSLYLLVLVGLALLHYFLVTGGVTYEEVSFQVDDHTVTATYAVSSDYDGSSLLPGVLVFHGFVASKEWMIHLTSALARNGFAVLAVDQNGHGGNNGGEQRVATNNETITANGKDAVGALNYLASLPSVDPSFYSAAGWSMGASTTMDLNKAAVLGLTGGATLSASVLIGNDLECTDFPFDETYPEDLLNLIGINDELVDPVVALTKMGECAVSGTVEEGVLYGGFATDDARKVVFTSSDHIFEAVEPAIIDETIRWLQQSYYQGDSVLVDALPEIGFVPSLNHEFLGSIISVVWLGFFLVYFELTKDTTVLDLSVAKASDASDVVLVRNDGELYKWWWWMSHNALILLGALIGNIFDLILTATVCVSFGATMLGWAILLPIIFATSIYLKKGKPYLARITKSGMKQELGIFTMPRDDKVLFVKTLFRSPIGFIVVFIGWVLITQAVMGAVPFTYGLAIPLFRGLDNSGPRRWLLLFFFMLIFGPGWYYELETVSLRINRDFTIKNTLQLMAARSWLILVALLFLIITVFGAQARVLGPFGFTALILYPMAFVFAVLSIGTQFGRSRGHGTAVVSIFFSGIVSLLLAQILPFEGCA